MNKIYFAAILLAVLGVNGDIPNISYGSDPEQVFDFYLPKESAENDTTKCLILIHGGAWGGGQKSDMEGFIFYLQEQLPTYYMANMEYRLGTFASPGFPKQLEDITLLISYIKSSFAQSVTFGLMGSSAGGHLSMLYDYGWDSEDDVKLVISHVGPADLNDVNYINHPEKESFFYLVGPCLHSECPDLYSQSSPVEFIHEGVAPTIGFYGNADHLVPNTQMPSLREKLTAVGVPNDFTVYNGGHGDWVWEDQMDMAGKIGSFVKTNW